MTLVLFTESGDMVEAATYVRDGREWVRWLSDWDRASEIDRLKRWNRGPATYGHVDLEVLPYDEWCALAEKSPAPRRCYCPDDCGCHYPWRGNVCGCCAHESA